MGIKCVKLQSTDILGLAFYTTPPVVAAVYDTSNVNTFFYGSDTTQITVGQQFIFSSSAPYAARMSIAGWLETNPDTVNRFEPDANGNVQCPLSVIPEYNVRSTMQPSTEFVTQPPRGPATGERGSDGDMGTIGPIGPTGAPGVIGVAPTGYEGEIGVTGVDGLIGAQVNGSIGAVGPQGNVTGPTGPQGYQGPIGLRGPPGPRGPAYNSSLDPQASTNEQGNKNTLVMGIIIWAAVLSFVTIIVFIILIVYCCRVMAEGKRNEDDGLEGDPINAKTYSSIENKTYGAPDTPGELRHRPQAKEKAKEKEKAKDKVKPKKNSEKEAVDNEKNTARDSAMPVYEETQFINPPQYAPIDQHHEDEYASVAKSATLKSNISNESHEDPKAKHDELNTSSEQLLDDNKSLEELRRSHDDLHSENSIGTPTSTIDRARSRDRRDDVGSVNMDWLDQNTNAEDPIVPGSDIFPSTNLNTGATAL